MAEKAFKTIDEQLDLLRSRGLTIDDESKAKQFLLYNNYYRITMDSEIIGRMISNLKILLSFEYSF